MASDCFPEDVLQSITTGEGVNETAIEASVINDVNLGSPVYINSVYTDDDKFPFKENITQVYTSQSEGINHVKLCEAPPVVDFNIANSVNNSNSAVNEVPTYSTLSLQEIKNVLHQIDEQGQSCSTLPGNEKIAEDTVLDDILNKMLQIEQTKIPDNMEHFSPFTETIHDTHEINSTQAPQPPQNAQNLNSLQDYIKSFQPDLEQSCNSNAVENLSEGGNLVVDNDQVGIVHLQNDQISELSRFDNVIVVNEEIILDEVEKLDKNNDIKLQTKKGNAISVNQTHQKYNATSLKQNSSKSVIIQQDTLKQLLDIVVQSQSEMVIPSKVKKTLPEKTNALHCGYCKLRVPTEDCLIKHMKMFHLEKKNQQKVCGFCNQTFQNKAKLQDHVLAVHAIKSDSLECVICHKHFKSKSSLRRHEKTHADVKRYQCPFCGLFFKGAQPMIHHMTISHPKADNKKLFTCLTCNISFTSEQLFEKHIYWKHSQKKNQHQSAVQSNIVSSSTSIDGDEDYTVDNETPPCYQCLKCNVMYSHADNILDHINNVHKGQFDCPQCTCHFLYYSEFERHLKDHLKIHDDKLSKSSLSCMICNIEIYCKEDIIQHIQSHQICKQYNDPSSSKLSSFTLNDIDFFTVALRSGFGTKTDEIGNVFDYKALSASFRLWKKRLVSHHKGVFQIWENVLECNKHILYEDVIVCLLCCEEVLKSNFENHIKSHIDDIERSSVNKPNVDIDEDKPNSVKPNKGKPKSNDAQKTKSKAKKGKKKKKKNGKGKTSLDLLADVAGNVVKVTSTKMKRNLVSDEKTFNELNSNCQGETKSKKIGGRLLTACQRGMKEREMKSKSIRESSESMLSLREMNTELDLNSCLTESNMPVADANIEQVLSHFPEEVSMHTENDNQLFEPSEESNGSFMYPPEVDDLPLGCDYTDFVFQRNQDESMFQRNSSDLFPRQDNSYFNANVSINNSDVSQDFTNHEKNTSISTEYLPKIIQGKQESQQQNQYYQLPSCPTKKTLDEVQHLDRNNNNMEAPHCSGENNLDLLVEVTQSINTRDSVTEDKQNKKVDLSTSNDYEKILSHACLIPETPNKILGDASQKLSNLLPNPEATPVTKHTKQKSIIHTPEVRKAMMNPEVNKMESVNEVILNHSECDSKSEDRKRSECCVSLTSKNDLTRSVTTITKSINISGDSVPESKNPLHGTSTVRKHTKKKSIHTPEARTALKRPEVNKMESVDEVILNHSENDSKSEDGKQSKGCDSLTSKNDLTRSATSITNSMAISDDLLDGRLTETESEQERKDEIASTQKTSCVRKKGKLKWSPRISYTPSKKSPSKTQEKEMDIKKVESSSVPKRVKDQTKNISRTPEIQNIKVFCTPVVKTRSVSRNEKNMHPESDKMEKSRNVQIKTQVKNSSKSKGLNSPSLIVKECFVVLCARDVEEALKRLKSKARTRNVFMEKNASSELIARPELPCNTLPDSTKTNATSKKETSEQVRNPKHVINSSKSSPCDTMLSVRSKKGERLKQILERLKRRSFDSNNAKPVQRKVKIKKEKENIILISKEDIKEEEISYPEEAVSSLSLFYQSNESKSRRVKRQRWSAYPCPCKESNTKLKLQTSIKQEPDWVYDNEVSFKPPNLQTFEDLLTDQSFTIKQMDFGNRSSRKRRGSYANKSRGQEKRTKKK
ncbi:uncharacterized protein LOC130612244 isoform X1 [Hydractinia symbiolongicarpus]|uniref:uncharacterized protein LOC130612244 isoform X1 n=1 Tax=Hydractinia symbiolongicarpus TaxID=13093 RepID=UPI002549E6A9|nr:uncharacterized protein LOC130612244 isoform X1 [Hydractinia symbiolongicarpus]